MLNRMAHFGLVAVSIFELGLGLALHAYGQQPAVTPSPAPTPINGQMIIWSGAKTQLEAEKQLAEFGHYSDALRSFLSVGAEVIQSSTVQGLNPGFFVVALGVCGAQDLDFPLSVFQAIEPRVYTKTVHYSASDAPAAPDCPALVEVPASGDNPVYWKLGEAVRTVTATGTGAGTKTGTLVALPFSYDWSEQGDFAREYFEVRIELLLIGPGRVLLDSSEYEGPSDATTLKAVRISGSSIFWDLEYANPPCDPSGDRFVSWAQSFWASSEGPQIRTGKGDARRLKSGKCGYAEESDAIQGKHK